MPAAIRRSFPRPELLRQDESKRARDVLAAVAAGYAGSATARRVVAQAVAQAIRVVSSETASRNERSFLMMYPPQNRVVVEWLSTKSRWPKVATRLWAWLFEFVAPRDGEILITREGLIERVGAKARAVDGVLAELVKLGALRKERVPEPGKQGRGTVRYFMNANVATYQLTPGERDAAQRAAPRLTVVGSSALPTERRSRAALPAPVVS